VHPFVRGSDLMLRLYFTPEAAQRLRRVTGENVGKHMALLLNSRVRSAVVIAGAVGPDNLLVGAVPLPVGDAERMAETIRLRWPNREQ
jgi:preprotein translocase subunit SecD